MKNQNIYTLYDIGSYCSIFFKTIPSEYVLFTNQTTFMYYPIYNTSSKILPSYTDRMHRSILLYF